MKTLCQATARQLGPYGITSNAIAPGLVLTGLLPRTGGPEMADRLRQDVERILLGHRPVGFGSVGERIAHGTE